MARLPIQDGCKPNRSVSIERLRPSGDFIRASGAWLAFSLVFVLALAGCGGSDSEPTYQPLPTLSEDKLPEGARVDLGAFTQQSIHARDQWGYERMVDAVVSGTVTLSVVAEPATDGSFTMTETDSTDASLNRTLAYRKTEDGLVRVDPFGAKVRYPGLFAALPELLEYPAQAYPIGSVRHHLRQGSLKTDIDGDGYEDFYRAEFSQAFIGYQQLMVLGEDKRTARFTNTMALTLKTTSDNKSVTRVISEDVYFATGVGIVRSDRMTKDGDGAVVVPAYRLELSNATVGNSVLPRGLLWKYRDSGTHRTLLGIASSRSHVVAVGGLGTIVSSVDGKAWTTRQSGVGVHLNGVATSGSLFVAVGDLGAIVTSTDAATWATRTSGTSNNLRGVAWTGSQFVAVGDVGTVLTSPDGAAWTVRPSGTGADLYAVAGHSKRIVAVGSFSSILSSPTGATWTAHTSSCCETLSGVVWSGTQFLAVGSRLGNSRASWQTSNDGMTWAPQGNDCCMGLRAVAWSGAHFVAVGDYYTISSADGIASSSSSAFTGTFGSRSLYAVAWHAGEFLAVGADGALFAALPRRADVGTLYGIAASSSAVVAVGAQGLILSSSDGATWTVRHSGLTTTLRGIASSGSIFVTVGDKGTILSSSDAARWVSRSSGTSNQLRGVTWTGAQFVAIGTAGTILVSPDGMTWTARTSPTTSNLIGIAGSSSRITVISDQATVLTSSDGASWVESHSSPGYLGGVLWSGTQFVAFGSQNALSVYTSYDGLQWTARRTNMGNPMYGGCASDAGIVLVGQFGLTLTSADGIAWEQSEGLLGGQDLYAAAWFSGRLIMVGQGRIHSQP